MYSSFQHPASNSKAALREFRETWNQRFNRYGEHRGGMDINRCTVYGGKYYFPRCRSAESFYISPAHVIDCTGFGKKPFARLREIVTGKNRS